MKYGIIIFFYFVPVCSAGCCAGRRAGFTGPELIRGIVGEVYQGVACAAPRAGCCAGFCAGLDRDHRVLFERDEEAPNRPDAPHPGAREEAQGVAYLPPTKQDRATLLPLLILPGGLADQPQP